MSGLWTFTDREGSEVPANEGAELLIGDRALARTEIGDGRVVVTQHTVIRQPDGHLETVVYPADGYQPEAVRRRYARLPEAITGHDEVVAEEMARPAGPGTADPGEAGTCGVCGQRIGVDSTGRLVDHHRLVEGAYVLRGGGAHWCDGGGRPPLGIVVRGFTADGERVDSWAPSLGEALALNASAIDEAGGTP